MQELLKSVSEFHRLFNIENGTRPRLLDHKESNLRYRLMKEENEEYFTACYQTDITEVADALGDKLYILLGTILKHGMQDVIVDVFNEIQKSNLSKLGADSKPIIREDGKILKGSGYFKPNIKPILDKALSSNLESTDKPLSL